MDWYRIDDNPLNKPILTQLSYSYMRHKAAMSNTRHGVLILLLTGPFWKESTRNLKFSKIKKLSRDPWNNIVFATQGAGDFINQTNIYIFHIQQQLILQSSETFNFFHPSWFWLALSQYRLSNSHSRFNSTYRLSVSHRRFTTHWPLGDLNVILKMQFSILFYWMVSSDLLMIMPSDECHRTLLMISQHWVR